MKNLLAIVCVLALSAPCFATGYGVAAVQVAPVVAVQNHCAQPVVAIQQYQPVIAAVAVQPVVQKVVAVQAVHAVKVQAVQVQAVKQVRVRVRVR